MLNVKSMLAINVMLVNFAMPVDNVRHSECKLGFVVVAVAWRQSVLTVHENSWLMEMITIS